MPISTRPAIVLRAPIRSGRSLTASMCSAKSRANVSLRLSRCWPLAISSSFEPGTSFSAALTSSMASLRICSRALARPALSDDFLPDDLSRRRPAPSLLACDELRTSSRKSSRAVSDVRLSFASPLIFSAVPNVGETRSIATVRRDRSAGAGKDGSPERMTFGEVRMSSSCSLSAGCTRERRLPTARQGRSLDAAVRSARRSSRSESNDSIDAFSDSRSSHLASSTS